MKLKNKMLSMLILPLGILLNQPIEPDNSIKTPVIQQPLSKIQVIEKYSAEYGLDKNLVYSMLMCESTLNENAIGDSGKSKGIAQYNPNTFVRHEKKLGEDLDAQSWHDSIKLMTFAIANGMGNEWTSYVAIKNGGSYTFTNSYTGQIQTVKCNLREIPK